MSEEEKLHELDQAEYTFYFSEPEKRKRALKSALDIRKFEIEHYWRRAGYFWAFIAATFTVYAAVPKFSPDPGVANVMAVALSGFGVLISIAWFLVNKGSKYWQENWENHVDLLEQDVTGPLYRIVVSRPKIEGFKPEKFLLGPGGYSVSRINQLISIYVVVLWLGLFADRVTFALLDDPLFSIKVSVVFLTILTLVFGYFLLAKMETHEKQHKELRATIREARILRK